MKLKKNISVVLTTLLLTAASGCGTGESGKINLKVGLWPDETTPESLATQNKTKDEFMEANPDINIIGDTYKYDTKTFTMKASANQLPNMFKPWFTEIQQIIRQGYAADITDAMKAHGFDTGLNPELIKFVTGEDGKIYGIPTDAYMQSLYINKDIFKEAGLVNADGSIRRAGFVAGLRSFQRLSRKRQERQALHFRQQITAAAGSS